MPTQADLALAAIQGGQAAAPAQTQADAALAALKAAQAPEEDHGFGQQVGDFISAAGHHVMSLPHGLAQLVENTVAAGASKLPDNPVSRYIVNTANADNRAMADREAAYQKSTPTNTGSFLGAATGEVAPFLISGPAKGLQAVGDYVGGKVASLLPSGAQKIGAKLASGATQGAAVSTAQPVANSPSITDLVTGASTPDYWSQKLHQVKLGAALGGATPVVTGGIQAGIGGIKNAVAPVLNPGKVVAPSLERVLTDDGRVPLADVIAKLSEPQELVPGSLPTTAQVLQQPQAVMAEKAVGNMGAGKESLVARENANNAARLDAIQGVAKTPEALDAAVQARTDATAPMIDKLLVNPTTSQPIRAGVILDKIGQLEGTSLGQDPVVKKTLAAVRQQVTDATQHTDVGAYTFTPSQLARLKDEPYVRADLLDSIRQNLRTTIRENASSGIVSSKQEAGLEPLADHITSAIESVNPGYRRYLETYAKASQPINAMESAGRILDYVAGGSRSLNSAGDAQVTLQRLGSALAKELKGPYQMDPAARAQLEAVQADLQRSSVSNSIRSPGSDTVFNAQAPGWLASKIYGPDMEGGGKAAKLIGAALGAAGGSLGGGHLGAGAGAAAGAAAVDKLSKLGQARVQEMLAKALSDPKTAAELLAIPPTAPAAAGGLVSRIPQINSLLLGRALQQPQP